MLPPAPVRFSITIAWPHNRVSSGARVLVMMSVVPPAEKPMMIRTSRVGQPDWAITVLAQSTQRSSKRRIRVPKWPGWPMFRLVPLGYPARALWRVGGWYLRGKFADRRVIRRR